MFGRINKKDRFENIKNHRFFTSFYKISSGFYLRVRKTVLGEMNWEDVFMRASFQDCIGFFDMKIYESGNIYSYALERAVDVILQENGEKKYWLMIRLIPYLRDRRYGGFGWYITPEINEKLKKIYEGIEEAPNYSIFLWASDGEGLRCSEGRCSFVGVKSLINEINLKAEKISGKKALKIKYLKKEGREKFCMS